MPQTVQVKARQLVVEYHNKRADFWQKKPITIQDVRILFWRSVIIENVWTVVLWVRDPVPIFYTVSHDKKKDESTVSAYYMYETEVFGK